MERTVAEFREVLSEVATRWASPRG
jgi:hypothetical protein